MNSLSCALICSFVGSLSKPQQVLIPFLTDVVQDNGFDGIYLDNHVATNIWTRGAIYGYICICFLIVASAAIHHEIFPRSLLRVYSFTPSSHFKDDTKQFDADGDGIADSADQVIAQYTAFSNALSMGLRETLGHDAIIVGNSAGSISDAALNGVNQRSLILSFCPFSSLLPVVFLSLSHSLSFLTFNSILCIPYSLLCHH